MGRRHDRQTRMSGIPVHGIQPAKKEIESVEEPEIRTYVAEDKLVFEASLLSLVAVGIAWLTGGSVLAALVPIVFVGLHVATAKDKVYMQEDETDD